MSTAIPNADPELAIWERVFVPDPERITVDQARYLQGIQFSPSDLDRMNELSAKASEGTLTSEERLELDHYIHVGHLLSILKAKVRRTLKKAAS